MASYSDIQHRFANRLEGRNGRISASSCRYEGRNFYSYSTVFGQWVDISKNVVVIFDGSTSPSSSKHKLGKWCFPDDAHVFPYNDNHGGWYSYDGCDLMGWEREFTFKHRCILIDYYVTKIHNSLAAIKDGKKKGLEKVDFTAWSYVEELCILYKDTTINKWCKQSTDKDKVKLAKLLKAGERNVQVLTDVLFGEGTFKRYWNYSVRFRKADDKRAKVEALCNRLGIRSPYDKWGGYKVLDHEMNADDIRKLSAKERVELHFKALARKEYKEHESERKKLYNKRKDNAYRWIVGFEPVIESEYSHSYKCCEKVRNMYTGEVYGVGGNYIYGFYWLNTSVSFDYDGFRKSDNKEQWIRELYSKCKEVADNRKALALLKKYYGITSDKERSWDDDKYIAYRGEDMTECDRILCERFIAKQNKHYADEAARERAREIERLRREEEERKEKEYMEQVKQEQINECLMRGVEGCRDLWRKHLQPIDTARLNAPDTDNAFFYEGNVLLRLNLGGDKVETSKNIRIPVEVCKKMWRIVSKWHENPASFKEMSIDTKGSGRYTISSYEDDILTAGCHKIAYAEMQRMYNEIINA